jgi:hypothetical protein
MTTPSRESAAVQSGKIDRQITEMGHTRTTSLAVVCPLLPGQTWSVRQAAPFCFA